MKKLVILVVVVLVGVNLYLGNEVLQLKGIINEARDERVQIVENKYVTFADDVTDVVEKSINKVVGVTSLNNNRLLGTGSGAIIEVSNNEVFIATNFHVIENADQVQIIFANQKEFEAEVIGYDVFSDLALLKVNPDFSVNSFRIGESTTTKIGEWVLAIGSPLGLEFQSSVTMGILSGKDRIVAVDLNSDGIADWDMNVLQTDAAINPGNSGGPLINLKGEIIGINSMKIILETVEGMGFSIPIDEAMPILNQLKEFGEVVRPVLGVTAVGVAEMTLYQKNSLGISLNQSDGVFITHVMDASPAFKADIQKEDILLMFDGTRVKSFKQFRQLLYQKNIGDEVKVLIVRGNKEITMSVTLE
jgi:serine protease Do